MFNCRDHLPPLPSLFCNGLAVLLLAANCFFWLLAFSYYGTAIEMVMEHHRSHPIFETAIRPDMPNLITLVDALLTSLPDFLLPWVSLLLSAGLALSSLCVTAWAEEVILAIGDHASRMRITKFFAYFTASLLVTAVIGAYGVQMLAIYEIQSFRTSNWLYIAIIWLAEATHGDTLMNLLASRPWGFFAGFMTISLSVMFGHLLLRWGDQLSAGTDTSWNDNRSHNAPEPANARIDEGQQRLSK